MSFNVAYARLSEVPAEHVAHYKNELREDPGLGRVKLVGAICDAKGFHYFVPDVLYSGGGTKQAARVFAWRAKYAVKQVCSKSGNGTAKCIEPGWKDIVVDFNSNTGERNDRDEACARYVDLANLWSQCQAGMPRNTPRRSSWGWRCITVSLR